MWILLTSSGVEWCVIKLILSFLCNEFYFEVPTQKNRLKIIAVSSQTAWLEKTTKDDDKSEHNKITNIKVIFEFMQYLTRLNTPQYK